MTAAYRAATQGFSATNSRPFVAIAGVLGVLGNPVRAEAWLAWQASIHEESLDTSFMSIYDHH